MESDYLDAKHRNKALTDQEIAKLKDVCQVLETFFEVTQLLSGEKYATQSVILPSQSYLYKAVN